MLISLAQASFGSTQPVTISGLTDGVQKAMAIVPDKRLNFVLIRACTAQPGITAP